MKRSVLLAVFALSFAALVNAQEVGIRVGQVTGGNVALDVVFGTSQFTRLHGDLSFGNGVGIDILWDFLYRPIGGEAFNWYVGVGPYAFLGDPFQLGVLGEVGIEYRFNTVPIVIGADWRPWFRLIDNTDIGFGGFGFNARWAFGGSE
jgi:hypothetical protein